MVGRNVVSGSLINFVTAVFEYVLLEPINPFTIRNAVRRQSKLREQQLPF
jgi:hypothetical protein